MTSSFAELQPDLEPLGTVSDFVNEFIDAVKPQHFFDGFGSQETELLSSYLEVFGVPRQSTVLREGDEGDFLAILVTGKAVIVKTTDQTDVVLREVGPGEIIGEMSLIDGRPRIATCITTEPSDFAVLTLQNLNALLSDHPRLGNKFLLVLLKIATTHLREVASSAATGATVALV